MMKIFAMKMGWFFFMLLLTISCTEKAKITSQPSVDSSQVLSDEVGLEATGQVGDPLFRLQEEGNTTASISGQKVGVFFMPSWDAGSGKNAKDIFWACLQGKEDCPFLNSPTTWGPKGRIYNQKYPYEGP